MNPMNSNAYLSHLAPNAFLNPSSFASHHPNHEKLLKIPAPPVSQWYDKHQDDFDRFHGWCHPTTDDHCTLPRLPRAARVCPHPIL